MNRLSLTDIELSPEQQRLRESVLSGPRGKFGGPFPIWLLSPGAFTAAEALGRHLRFDAALPKPLKEFAVLLVARHWHCQYEWEAHCRHAIAAGLAPTLIADIANGQPLRDLDADYAAVHSFVQELLQTQRVSDETFEETSRQLDGGRLVELIMLAGYYSLIGMTLNSFEVPGDQPAAYPMRDDGAR